MKETTERAISLCSQERQPPKQNTNPTTNGFAMAHHLVFTKSVSKGKGESGKKGNEE
jgi:hypothetical protein